MIDWDKILLTESEIVAVDTEEYSRFKDVIQILNEALEKGSKIVRGKVEIDEQTENFLLWMSKLTLMKRKTIKSFLNFPRSLQKIRESFEWAQK